MIGIIFGFSPDKKTCFSNCFNPKICMKGGIFMQEIKAIYAFECKSLYLKCKVEKFTNIIFYPSKFSPIIFIK